MRVILLARLDHSTLKVGSGFSGISSQYSENAIPEFTFSPGHLQSMDNQLILILLCNNTTQGLALSRGIRESRCQLLNWFTYEAFSPSEPRNGRDMIHGMCLGIEDTGAMLRRDLGIKT